MYRLLNFVSVVSLSALLAGCASDSTRRQINDGEGYLKTAEMKPLKSATGVELPRTSQEYAFVARNATGSAGKTVDIRPPTDEIRRANLTASTVVEKKPVKAPKETVKKAVKERVKSVAPVVYTTPEQLVPMVVETVQAARATTPPTTRTIPTPQARTTVAQLPPPQNRPQQTRPPARQQGIVSPVQTVRSVAQQPIVVPVQTAQTVTPVPSAPKRSIFSSKKSTPPVAVTATAPAPAVTSLRSTATAARPFTNSEITDIRLNGYRGNIMTAIMSVFQQKDYPVDNIGYSSLTSGSILWKGTSKKQPDYRAKYRVMIEPINGQGTYAGGPGVVRVQLLELTSNNKLVTTPNERRQYSQKLMNELTGTLLTQQEIMGNVR